MADGALETLFLNVARARGEGKSFGEMMQMAIEFLAAQVPGYANGRRDDFLQRANDSMVRFAALNDAGGRAPMAERAKAMRFLTDLLSELDAAVPKVPVADKAAQLQAMLQRHQAEHEKKQAAHRKERLARGLSERAGSGAPEPAVLIHALPGPDLDLSVRPTEPLQGANAEAVRIVQERYGREAPILRDLGESVSTILAARAARDQQVLAGLPLGASRFGGLPDLPPGEAWPVIKGKKMPFVAQINLAQFPAAHGVLPADGHLLFFVLASNEEGFWPPAVKVLHYRGSAESLARAPLPGRDEVWPDWCDERVYEVCAATANPPGGTAGKRSRKMGETLGWLFGEFEFDETPGEVADERFEDGDDWITLMAVMSNGSMLWSDAGHLYLIARRGDIVRRDFSRVLAVVCSS